MKLFKNGARAFCILNFPSLFGATIPLPGLSALSLFIPCTITRQVSAACSVERRYGRWLGAKQCGVPVRKVVCGRKKKQNAPTSCKGTGFCQLHNKEQFRINWNLEQVGDASILRLICIITSLSAIVTCNRRLLPPLPLTFVFISSPIWSILG